jgi:hypothetical protein
VDQSEGEGQRQAQVCQARDEIEEGADHDGQGDERLDDPGTHGHHLQGRQAQGDRVGEGEGGDPLQQVLQHGAQILGGLPAAALDAQREANSSQRTRRWYAISDVELSVPGLCSGSRA